VKAKLQAVQRSRKARLGIRAHREKPVITDIEVLVMNDDKIAVLHRFLGPQRNTQVRISHTEMG
jgi:hypothetical protein